MTDLIPSEVVIERRKELLRAGLNMILTDAARWGMVVTVKQVPLKPLSQGHYDTVVEVREKMVRS